MFSDYSLFMKIFLFISCLVFPGAVFSQVQTEQEFKPMQGKYEDSSAQEDSVRSFTSIDVLPQFPGGQQGWAQFLMQNLKYPEEARKKKIMGRVLVQFVVEKDGSLSDMKILRGIGGGCDEETVRVLQLSPKWKPGVQNGRTVRVSYVMPLSFRL